MRNLTFILQLSAHALIGMASLMLGYAEGTVFPSLLTIPVVLFSIFGSNRWPRLQLSPLVANVCGLLAFGLAAGGLFDGSVESRLLSGAHLLIALTWIVLLQSKKDTQYWWLFALAVLQVSVGSILTHRGLYGLFLVLFLFLSIWTLAIYSLQQAGQRFLQPDATGDDKEMEGRAPTHSGFGRQSGLFLAPSSVEGSIQLDRLDRWFSIRFVAGIFGLTCGALMIAMLFFLFIPRQWIGKQTWASGRDDPGKRDLVGFAENVQLGELGAILKSNERVMEIKVFDNDTDEQISVEDYASQLGYDEPLFRGQVLDTYTDGRWTKSRTRFSNRSISNSPGRGLIRQEIHLAPIGTAILFAMRPMPIQPVKSARLVDRSSQLALQPIGSVLRRDRRSSRQQRMIYEVFTRKTKAIHQDKRQDNRIPDEISWYPYRGLPRNQLVKLREEARRISGYDSPAGRPRNSEMARRLVSYLRDSGQFQYSLTAKREQFSIDPIEEFLTRKTGHCEYFASALTLMFRAVKIPSRLVSGFKGGQENELTGRFEVEQRHAHAWVEAMIDGHWTVLDPTPADERNRLLDKWGGFQSWRDLVNFFSDFWSLYIVDLNFSKQQQSFYKPMKQSSSKLWETVSGDKSEKSSVWTVLKAFLMNPKQWFSWQGGIIAFALMLICSGLFWLIRKLISFVLRFDSKRKARRTEQRILVEFYERFRKICLQKGLSRKPAETEREFAKQVWAFLAEKNSAGCRNLNQSQLVDAFYSVRFGHLALPERQYEEINHELTALETSLTSSESNK